MEFIAILLWSAIVAGATYAYLKMKYKFVRKSSTDYRNV